MHKHKSAKERPENTMYLALSQEFQKKNCEQEQLQKHATLDKNSYYKYVYGTLNQSVGIWVFAVGSFIYFILAIVYVNLPILHVVVTSEYCTGKIMYECAEAVFAGVPDIVTHRISRTVHRGLLYTKLFNIMCFNNPFVVLSQQKITSIYKQYYL